MQTDATEITHAIEVTATTISRSHVTAAAARWAAAEKRVGELHSDPETTTSMLRAAEDASDRACDVFEARLDAWREQQVERAAAPAEQRYVELMASIKALAEG